MSDSSDGTATTTDGHDVAQGNEHNKANATIII